MEGLQSVLGYAQLQCSLRGTATARLVAVAMINDTALPAVRVRTFIDLDLSISVDAQRRWWCVSRKMIGWSPCRSAPRR